MDDQPRLPTGAPDPVAAAPSIAKIAVRSQRIIADFLVRHTVSDGSGDPDPMKIRCAF